MRTTVVAAALLVCLSALARAYDLQTKNGQAVCDSLRAFEELTIAINTYDEQFIEEIGNNGCRMPPPGVRMELIEAYPDETVLLFSKLAEYTRIGSVPDHIERLTHLAKVRVLTPDQAPSVGFTLLRVSPRSVGQ